MNDNISAYQTRYSGFIKMLPNETLFQITNCSSDIAFAGNLSVDLINQCQEVVRSLEIGGNFFYREFTDSNGVAQIAYEFGLIGEDYYEELLFLRFTHTVSDNVWFSNGFLITYLLQEETSRFEYKNDSVFKGIPYDIANYFQTIRLTCFKNDIDYDIESEDYKQLSGNQISLRSTITKIEKYLFYVLDFFTYNRLVVLLNHDIVYINGYKISNKPKATKGDRIEDSNLFQVDFEANPTEEYKSFAYQLFEPLRLDAILPLGNYSLSTLPTSITGSFNKNVTKLTGFISVYNLTTNTLIHRYNETDISLLLNNINIDITGLITSTGDYRIIIDGGLFKSTIGEIFEQYSWNFSVLNGDFYYPDFSNTDFNTN